MQSYLDSCRLTGASWVFRRRWLQKKKDLKLGVSKLEEENLHRLIAERGAHRFLRPANAVFYCQPTPFFTAIQRHFLRPANASFYGQPTPFLRPANAIFYGQPTPFLRPANASFYGLPTPVFTASRRQFLRLANASYHGLPTPLFAASQRRFLPPDSAVLCWRYYLSAVLPPPSFAKTVPHPAVLRADGPAFLLCLHAQPPSREVEQQPELTTAIFCHMTVRICRMRLQRPSRCGRWRRMRQRRPSAPMRRPARPRLPSWRGGHAHTYTHAPHARRRQTRTHALFYRLHVSVTSGTCDWCAMVCHLGRCRHI